MNQFFVDFTRSTNSKYLIIMIKKDLNQLMSLRSKTLVGLKPFKSNALIPHDTNIKNYTYNSSNNLKYTAYRSFMY